MDVSKAKPQQVQQTQAAQRTQEVRETQQRELQAKAAERQKTEEPKPKPVVNTQGQTTGQLLNVTA
ncbi:hypothetical protein CHU94_06650 [Rhodoferax sp. TH121]|uniref:hypothetical protein n=1 Tax=Rhodoferax sp. TH121 TaxID=2022803 RepID=UPI000BD0C787|nr:hypothetical protein [Rhodoferax sp. TH121]OYQ40812.1 hypothetical protein CHU94_06650 [Rhodoferax sp. TH121]